MNLSLNLDEVAYLVAGIIFIFVVLWILKLWSLTGIDEQRANLKNKYYQIKPVNFGFLRLLFFGMLGCVPVFLLLIVDAWNLFTPTAIHWGILVIIPMFYFLAISLIKFFMIDFDDFRVLQLVEKSNNTFFISHQGQLAPVVKADNYGKVHLSKSIKRFANKRYVCIGYKKSDPAKFTFIEFPQKDEARLRKQFLFKKVLFFSTQNPPDEQEIRSMYSSL